MRKATSTMALVALVGAALQGQFSPADANITINVTSNGAPVAGASVSIAGVGTNVFAGVTGETGSVTFVNAPTDTYTATASAPGTTVGAVSGIAAGSNGTVTVTSSGTVFNGLNGFGAFAGDVFADGRSGVFYMVTPSIPPIHRTHDHGATWAPVTISSDDATNGIDGSRPVRVMATSGYPGEAAALSGDRVYFTRDFGVTWRFMAAPTGIEFFRTQLLWGHAPAPGSDSMLFIGAGANMYYADMSLAVPLMSPAMAAAANFKAAAEDHLAIGNGATQSFLAVAPAAGGSVRLYRVDTTPDRTADTANSLNIPNAAAPGEVTFMRLGGNPAGPTIGGSAAPDTLLVFTYDTNPSSTDPPPDVRMTTFIAGSYQPTTVMDFRRAADDGPYIGTPRAFLDEFGGTGTAVGSLAPIGTFGFLAQSWLERNGAALILRPLGGANSQKAFDAAFNGTTNRVIIGATSFGGGKSAQNGPLNRPLFPAWPAQAAAGTAPASGGISINGLNAAVVGDTAFQPGAPTHMAAALTRDGGDRVIGSVDTGASWFTLEARGADALDWWNGVSGQWILTGTRGARAVLPVTPDNMLSMVNLASAAFTTSTVLTPFANTQSTDFGLIGSAAGAQVRAIAGLTGADKAVVASTMTTNLVLVQAALSVVTLGGSSAQIASLGASFAPGTAPVALAYCPAGSAAAVADKLFVAVAASADGGTNGSIFTVSAPGGTPSVNPPLAGAANGDFRDVRVDCAGGTVWAGRYLTAASDSGLMKATASGVSLGAFATVALPVATTRQHRIETLDINPGNPSHVVAVSASGDLFATTNGGTTFQILNDTSNSICTSAPPCGRSFGVRPPGDVEITSLVDEGFDEGFARPAATVESGYALFGSGAGLYAATASPGLQPGSPGVPQAFQVVVSGLTLQLSWSAPISGGAPTAYVIQASTSNTFASIVYSQTLTGTSLTLTAPAGTAGTYFLRVHASNAFGAGPPTAATSVTLPAATIPPPGAPGAPVVQVTSNSRIVVTWTAPDGAIAPTSYKAYLTINGGPMPGSPFPLPGAATAVTSPGPLGNGAYTIAISALHIGGEGPQSPATAFTVGGPPGAPGTPQVTVNANGSIAVSWAPASGALTSYKAYVGRNTLPMPGSPFTLGIVTSVSSPPLPAGAYTIAISAVNGASESLPSPAIAFTIAAPSAPGTPVVTVNGNRSVTVTWAASSGPVSTYRAYVTLNGATLPGTPVNIGAVTTVTSAPLPPGSYTLALSALNGIGESAQTTAVPFTIP